MHSLLLTAALSEAHAGRRDEAASLLRASWSLRARLLRLPEWSALVLAMETERRQLAVLRRVPGGEDEWLRALQGEDPWRWTRDAAQGVGRYWLARLQAGGALVEAIDEVFGEKPLWYYYLSGGPWEEHVPLVSLPIRPYLRVCVAQVAAAHGRVARLAAEAGPCGIDVPRADEELRGLLPRWNLLRSECWWDLTLAYAVERAQRVQFELELTRQVLRTRRQVAERRLRGVPLEGQDVVSGTCERWRWRRTLRADGGFSLTFLGEEPPCPDLEGKVPREEPPCADLEQKVPPDHEEVVSAGP